MSVKRYSSGRLLSLLRKQRGVAVLTVLLVVAVGSALAYALASRQTVVMAQARHVLVGDAMRDMLLGGEVLARQMLYDCLLHTSPSPRDQRGSRMPSSA